MFQDRYEIESEIGQGGMGTVYKAHHRTLHDRVVAIKRIFPHLVRDESTRLRFEREARAAAALNHPNSIHIHDFGYDDEGPYLIMDYINGPGLKYYIQQHGPLSIDQTLTLGRELADVLDRAHRKKFYHRDVKSRNILMQDNRAILTDWGLVHMAEHSRLPGSSQGMGTPGYMSQEQLNGSEYIDGRTDLYSLGVVLYECLTGHLPYEGRTITEVISKMVQDHRTPLTTYRQDVPSWLVRVIDRCLDSNPEKRYATGAALKAALAAPPAPAPPKAEEDQPTQVLPHRPFVQPEPKPPAHSGTVNKKNRSGISGCDRTGGAV